MRLTIPDITHGLRHPTQMRSSLIYGWDHGDTNALFLSHAYPSFFPFAHVGRLQYIWAYMICACRYLFGTGENFLRFVAVLYLTGICRLVAMLFWNPFVYKFNGTWSGIVFRDCSEETNKSAQSLDETLGSCGMKCWNVDCVPMNTFSWRFCERLKQTVRLTGHRSRSGLLAEKNEIRLSKVVEYLQILIQWLQMHDISFPFSQMLKFYCWSRSCFL